MAQQGSLLPALVVKTWPQTTGSKDFELMGQGEDGRIFALKCVSDRDTLPLTEWLCYHLAVVVKIAVPPFQVMYTRDEQPVFASRWEGGNLSFNPTVLRRLSDPSRLSAIYTLDLFLQNHDRHTNNFIFQEAGDQVVVIAFDFSRCFIYHQFPLPAVPLHKDCDTRITRRAIDAHVVFDLAASLRTIELLEGVSAAHVDEWIAAAPDAWVKAQLKEQIIQWWDKETPNRLKAIREGVTNGTFL